MPILKIDEIAPDGVKVTIDWDKLSEFEKEDNTSGSRELACTAGVCEVVDLSAA